MGKYKEMRTVVLKQLKSDFWVVSAVDKDLRVFMSNSYTDSGMMFNTYLMQAEEDVILFGAPPARQMDEWLSLIVPFMDGKKQMTYVSFCDRNDARAIETLAGEGWELTVIGSTAALYALEDCAVRKICVRGSRTLTIGGRAFTFEVETAGNLCVFCEDEKILFSGMVLGSYCAIDEVCLCLASDKGSYLAGAKNYCRDRSGVKQPAKLWEIIEKARSLNIELLCPVHGPVVDGELERLFSVYAQEEESKQTKRTVALIYEPGNYAYLLASQIAQGIQESGEIQVELLDLSETNRDEVLEKAARAEALIFGTPEVKGRAAKSIYDVLTSLDAKHCKGKLVSVFWAADSQTCERNCLNQWLNSLGFDTNTNEFFCLGKPDEAMLSAAFEHGFAFGCSLQRIPNPRQPKMVKCLVCGEVFDASLGICPVCGVGLDQCIPAEEGAVLFCRDTDRNYLILGGGIAAVSAAEAIRKRDKTGTIRMVSAEKELPINRPMLTKDLKTVLSQPETLAVHDEQWYADLEIELMLGRTVMAIDSEKKCVNLDGGEVLPYDKLVYALGGECFIPPFKGWEKKGVVAIRHLSDMEELAGALERAKNAVVIGGGVLGLEAASELHRFGLNVTVLESAPQIMGRQIDEKNAAALRRTMERMGVSCFEGVSIEEIGGEDRAASVRLADGRSFPAEIVVVSCGIRANVQIAQAAGVTVDRSIVVDAHMQTNVLDIYACGDCVVFEGVNFQLWQEASSQGKVAGANAVGESLCYANQMLGCGFEGFHVSLFAIGDVGKREGVAYRTVELIDGVRGGMESYWFHGEQLEGAIVINKSEKIDEINRAVTTRARYDELF